MKKLLLTIVAAMATALVSNAQIYLAGDFQSWTPENALQVDASADGSYEVTIPTVNKFKMSTERGNWDTFNTGVFGYTGTITEPGTFNLVRTDTDQTLPWEGTWTIKVSADRSVMTLSTTTPAPTEKIFFLRGEMNNWGEGSSWQFRLVEGDMYKLENVEISTTQEFKIADSGWGAINYGGQKNMSAANSYQLVRNTIENCSMAADFAGTIYFNLATAEISFEEHEIVPPPPVSKELYIIGEYYGNWASTSDEYLFTREDNKYTLVLANGVQGEWKIWNGTWDYTFGAGGEPIELGSNEVWFNSSANFTLNTAYKTTIELIVEEGSDATNSGIPATLNITEDDSRVSDLISEDGEATYYNLQGVRIATPIPGSICIVVRNGKAMKSVVR